MLKALRTERERLEYLIDAVESYVRASGPPRRGRPPKWMTNVSTISKRQNTRKGAAKSRKKFSAATRRKMSLAQKKRYAEGRGPSHPRHHSEGTKRRKFSVAARRRMAEAQKASWARRKAAAAPA